MIQHTKGCLGKHIYDCTYEEMYWYMRAAQMAQWVFYFCVFSVKLSIALSNRRITGLSSERWMRTHYVFIGLFAVLLPINVCLEAFQCTPVPVGYSLKYIGRMKDPRQIKCLDARAISLEARITHILTDVALLCVPIIIVLRLQHISWKKKLRLTSIFALGGMSTIASILRNRTISRYLDDITWQYYEIYVWNYIDITFAVVVASLPALNGLLDVAISAVKTYTSSRGTRSSMSPSTRHSDPHGPSKDRGTDNTSSVVVQLEGRPSTVDTTDMSFGTLSNPKPGQSLDDFVLHDDTLSNYDPEATNTVHTK
jgi:hypothetical protein